MGMHQKTFKFDIDGFSTTNFREKYFEAHGNLQPISLDSRNMGQSGKYELKFVNLNR